MSILKKVTVALLLVLTCSFAAPTASHAMMAATTPDTTVSTNSSVQAQIAALLALLYKLQAQLAALQAQVGSHGSASATIDPDSIANGSNRLMIGTGTISGATSIVVYVADPAYTGAITYEAMKAANYDDLGHIFIGEDPQVSNGTWKVWFGAGIPASSTVYVFDGTTHALLASGKSITTSASGAPTVTIAATPTSIDVGGSTIINFNAVHANRCVLQYGNSELNVNASSGAYTMKPTVTTTYRLWCVNDPGTGKDGPSSEKSVTVTVSGSTNSSPVITSLSPYTVTKGTNVTITGSNLGNVTSVEAYYANGQSAASFPSSILSSISSNQVSFAISGGFMGIAGPGTYTAKVVTPNGTSNGLTFVAKDSTSTGSRLLCGLFRGGTDTAKNMIASPNPASSVADTDSACASYCDASGAKTGDMCLRGASVIKTYSGAGSSISTATYRGYMNGSATPFITTASISQSDALANCKLNASKNPTSSVRCTWGDTEIYNKGPQYYAKSCGLYRGGTDDATNMIASPNPATSIGDSDAACISYCDASGTKSGDLCRRGGTTIKTYGSSVAGTMTFNSGTLTTNSSSPVISGIAKNLDGVTFYMAGKNNATGKTFTTDNFTVSHGTWIVNIKGPLTAGSYRLDLVGPGYVPYGQAELNVTPSNSNSASALSALQAALAALQANLSSR